MYDVATPLMCVEVDCTGSTVTCNTCQHSDVSVQVDRATYGSTHNFPWRACVLNFRSLNLSHHNLMRYIPTEDVSGVLKYNISLKTFCTSVFVLNVICNKFARGAKLWSQFLYGKLQIFSPVVPNSDHRLLGLRTFVGTPSRMSGFEFA